VTVGWEVPIMLVIVAVVGAAR
jgi:hypothetical protein